MVLQAIKCIHCGSEKVVKNGKRKSGVQCLLCRKCKKAFQQEYTSNGAKPETKEMIIKMSLNGSGIRDISRVLKVSQGTVIAVLKKLKTLLSTSIQNIVIVDEES
jgi:transposase-like protein